MGTSSFFDPFFYVAVLFAALLAFADFLLGKEGRKVVRERIQAWWIYLEDSTFAGLGAADARAMLRWSNKHFGTVFSLRFAVRATVAMFLVYLLSFIVVLLAMDFGADEPADGSVPQIGLIDALIGEVKAVYSLFVEIVFPIFSEYWLVVASSVLAVLVSFLVTLAFLRMMAKSSALWLLALLFLLNLIASLGIVVLSVIINQMQRTMDVFDFGAVFVQMLWIAAGVAALVPVAVQIIITAIFMLSKLVRPLVQKPLSLLLLRLKESEKGAMTLIGSGVAAISKLIQEGLKFV